MQNNELLHYGVKGMRWGVRRYRKKDGTLTRRGEKHREAALKGLRDGKREYEDYAKRMKEATELNKRSLEISRAYDKESGKTSWNTLSLTDAYKATGRAYVNALSSAKIYDAYIKAYENDSMKVGEDYIVKNYKKGIIELSDSGRAKEAKIVDDLSPAFKKKYANEIKEYSY